MNSDMNWIMFGGGLPKMKGWNTISGIFKLPARLPALPQPVALPPVARKTPGLPGICICEEFKLYMPVTQAVERVKLELSPPVWLVSQTDENKLVARRISGRATRTFDIDIELTLTPEEGGLLKVTMQCASRMFGPMYTSYVKEQIGRLRSRLETMTA